MRAGELKGEPYTPLLEFLTFIDTCQLWWGGGIFITWGGISLGAGFPAFSLLLG